jgi:hypothetical protein
MKSGNELHLTATTFRESDADPLWETHYQTVKNVYYNYSNELYLKLLSFFLLMPTPAMDSVNELMLDFLLDDFPVGARDKREFARELLVLPLNMGKFVESERTEAAIVERLFIENGKLKKQNLLQL